MVKEVLVDENTRWKCIGSGKCCHKIGNEAAVKLFDKPVDQNGKCPKLNEKNRCTIYADRPLGCMMYPFYPDWEKLKQGKVNFTLGSLKIDAECPGFGHGDKVIDNVRLQKKLDKISGKLAERMNKLKTGRIKDLFMLE